MPQLTESDAEKLSPEQATELVRVLDLQARWDALLDDRSQKDNPVGLHGRQKAHDAFQAAWKVFSGKYPDLHLPEPTQNMPDRLAVWCGVLRVLFRRAEGVSPVPLMAKVHRLSDRLAAKMGEESVGRVTGGNRTEAVQELDLVIAWCNRLTRSPTPPSIRPKAHKEEAA